MHDLQAQISEFLKGNAEWIGIQTSDAENTGQTKLMDYACGNGIVSRVSSGSSLSERLYIILTQVVPKSLHPHFSKCIGVDLSDGMLDKYRATAADLGLDESRMIAIQGDLLAPTVKPTTPPLSEDELNGFDLVAICMALHHVEDIDLATKRLAERLRPGGVLLIIDWATRDSLNGTVKQPVMATGQTSSENNHHHHHHHHHQHHVDETINPKHPAAHTISHDSFSKDQIFSLFKQAGCGESKFVLANRLSPVPGARSGEMQLFWARATKL